MSFDWEMIKAGFNASNLCDIANRIGLRRMAMFLYCRPIGNMAAIPYFLRRLVIARIHLLLKMALMTNINNLCPADVFPKIILYYSALFVYLVCVVQKEKVKE